MGLRIPVEADVAHLGGGDQINDGVHHAQAGPEDRDDGQLLAGQHPNGGLRHGGLDFHFLGGQISGGLIAHELCNFSHQLPEFLDAGIFVSQQGELVLQKRMLQYV